MLIPLWMGDDVAGKQFALRGAFAAVVLMAGLFIESPALSQQPNAERYGTTGQPFAEEKKDESATAHFAPGHRVNDDTYRAICDQPKNRDHADLCQQWRMVKAAEHQILVNWLGLLLLAGTFVFTGIAAGAAIRAARYTKDAAVAGEQAASAALSSAKSDREANEFAIKHAEYQLRAYITKTLGEIRRFDIGETFQAHVVMKNTGQTPAHNVTAWIGVGLGVYPPNEPAPERPALEGGSKSVLGPGSEHHLTVDAAGPLTSQHFEMMERGEAAVRVVGGIQYKDVFGHPHTTTFDLFYGGKYGMNANLVLSNGPTGNEAD
jgi:hypothetical protein